MKDEDLFELWNKNKPEEKHFLTDEIKQSALKRSKDIFAKIRRKIIIEGAVSIVVALFFPALFWGMGAIFWLMIVFMAISASLSLYLSIDLLKKISGVNEQSILKSIQLKVAILKQYIKRLKVTSYFITPVGFILGMLVPLSHRDYETGETLFAIAFASPFLAISFWLVKKYIYLLYGKHLTETESILDEIENE